MHATPGSRNYNTPSLTPPAPPVRLHETPKLRLRFTSPDGQAHTGTITSTWHGRAPEVRDLFTGKTTPGTALLKNNMMSSIQRLYAELGCTVTCVEIVSMETTEWCARSEPRTP